MTEAMTITVPDDHFVPAAETAAGMPREYAVQLFREGKQTLAQSAHLCGLNIYDFLDALAQAEVPVIAYDPADLDRELSYFSRL